MEPITYFYAAHSAYAYLGSARFYAIAQNAGRTIEHRPIDLNRVLKAVGSTAFADRPDHYRQHFFHREIQRWSEYRDAPVGGRPTYHHHDITLPNCMLVAGVIDGQNMDVLAHRILEAHWRYDADHADPDTLKRLADEAGYDGDRLLAAAHQDDTKAAYERFTEEAIQHCVFGSPTYRVDGDLFYGQDRLEMIERALERPFATEWSGP
ncbi:MAG: 2-hydroxychromene-2-carboxylate isomerase [Pseudomonadota bacterium]